jgi:peptidoglycan L-alanyl-D-glutamate endopeptidase CwlK
MGRVADVFDRPITSMISHQERLQGVHADLCRVVTYAAQLLEEDSALHVRVQEGRRSRERQVELVKVGSSLTMDSRHVPVNGVSYAVDLLPAADLDHDGIVELAELYDWLTIYRVADAMARAARALRIAVVWGGCWDRQISTIYDAEQEHAAYVLRRKAAGRRAFSDGPHYELDRTVYRPGVAVV